MFKVAELLKATGGSLVCGQRDIVIKGISIDSRTIRLQEAFLAIKGDNFDGHDFILAAIKKGARCIILKKNYRPLVEFRNVTVIRVNDTARALGDIARFQREKFNPVVIAVTGSNGKTTTKEMIAKALSSKYRVLKNEGTKNNHIGLPLALVKLNQDHDIAVLEIGTNHFGEVDYLAKICRPNIGVITNIGPAHLEYLHSLAGVLREKYALIRNLKVPAIALLNADDKLLRREVLRTGKGAVIFSFGIKQKGDFSACAIRSGGNKTEFYLKGQGFSLKNLSRHNVYNALAAIGVARLFGVGYKQISRSLGDFKFPAGRFTLVKRKGITFIDDTYNANPLSLNEALQALASLQPLGRKILVMGDMYELGRSKEAFHRQAGMALCGICDVFLGAGRLSKLAAQSAEKAGFSAKNIFTCQNSLQARDILFSRINPDKNDIILVKGSRKMKMEEVLKF